jgi:hypothetical protein
MNKYFTLRRATLLLALTLPSLCWGFGGGSAALIVVNGNGGDSDENAAIAGLTPELVTAGYTVTPSVGVPRGSLAGYKQIWDIRWTTALSTPDITAYTTYLASGGSLFTMGENLGCCGARDTSIVALVTALGGGTLVLTSPLQTQTVLAPFTGPNPVTTVNYLGSGGSSTPANGAFITKDINNSGTGFIFGPGTMTNATAGALAIVFDVNFLELGGNSAALRALSANMIGFLAAPGGGAPSTTPAPSSILLVLIGLGATGLFAIRRRTKPNAA